MLSHEILQFLKLVKSIEAKEEEEEEELPEEDEEQDIEEEEAEDEFENQGQMHQLKPTTSFKVVLMENYDDSQKRNRKDSLINPLQQVTHLKFETPDEPQHDFIGQP